MPDHQPERRAIHNNEWWFVIGIVLAFAKAAWASDAHWPQFRGPDASGVSSDIPPN
jgi:hypothetical protein